ncbi:MAG: hypothetical protein GX304_03810 [Clostridiales bacterium]|jgi:hypothetical protein|nr:hypothetical protein [Clostridiales bacterium]
MIEWLRKLFRPFRPQKDKEIRSDVLGSYTGVTDNSEEWPTQDADDL